MQTARLDSYIFSMGFVRSRQQAKNLILDGLVTVNSIVVKKPSYAVTDRDEILLTDKPKYVGRGGLKLEKALRVFNISPKDTVCLDVGASTGGFTDCLLQNGAKKVFAVDVGHDQLDKSLLTDSRVINLENTHIKNLSAEIFEHSPIDIIVVDVSFISLKKVVPVLKKFMTENTKTVCLFKPQFEIGKINKGIVRHKKDHISLLRDFQSFLSEEALYVHGLDFSPIKGGDGNIEFLFYIKSEISEYVPDIAATVDKSRL